MNAALIYPHQLFHRHPALAGADLAVLVEDPLFFSQYRFHAQKLVLHRASMKQFAAELSQQSMEVKYVEARELANSGEVARLLKEWKITHAQFVDPLDDWLEQRLTDALRKEDLSFSQLTDPHFVTPIDFIEQFAESRLGSRNGTDSKKSRNSSQTQQSKRHQSDIHSDNFEDEARSGSGSKEYQRKYLKPDSKPNWFFTDFYIAQRKRMNLLLDDQSKPLGGKWSFDTENRKKLPKGIAIPPIRWPKPNSFVREAKQYVAQNFPDALGSADSFQYPIDRPSALQWLDDFIEQRLARFGDFEDAISESESFLFHSVLTPVLNIGLISPQEVIDAALQKLDHVPLNSLEGFIRQVIGWREFIRAAYIKLGRQQRMRNYWQHQHTMPASFYDGSTGIVPVDNVIHRLLQHSYSHHIERLMVLGNFMLLSEISPGAIYQWFMEMFIDAYDWVMVPNVYGMSQYADGGMITTKPYISGSAYILKMSHFKKGEWCPIWDGLYWNFIDKHRDFFSANLRMSVMVKQCQRMGEKLEQHRKVARTFLEKLHG